MTPKSSIETETGHELLKVRRPAAINAGHLKGSEIDRFDSQFWRVWTSQTRLARKVAEENGLRSRQLNGEAEVFVPLSLSSAVLPKFGAWRKRSLSEAAKEGLKSRLGIPSQIALISRLAPHRKALPATDGPSQGSQPK